MRERPLVGILRPGLAVDEIAREPEIRTAPRVFVAVKLLAPEPAVLAAEANAVQFAGLAYRDVHIEAQRQFDLLFQDAAHDPLPVDHRRLEIGIGGMKYVSFMISGQGAYSRLKYESGVHRVQRVPETESGGRIHTSTITVAIMPEVEDFDVQIDMNDCKFDVFRASGNGGQCVNTTDSAVRLTHIPTGIVISCQDEKSQLKNKDKALKVLRSRLYEMELAKQHDAEAEARRSQIGTGDRSEKIRTYNFPQGRVTDHRIKLTLHRLDGILNGDLDEIIDSLIAADQAAKLANLQEA